MSRHETIVEITRAIEQLDDEQLESIAALAQSLIGPSVYWTLPESERLEIDAAIARLDRGEGVSGKAAFDDMRRAIEAARQATKPGQ